MRGLYTSIALVALGLLPAAAGAQGDPLDSLIGRYAFNWLGDLEKQKCASVDQKLLNLFKSSAYKCDLKEVRNEAGATSVRCKGQSKEYLIFKTKASCEGERKTQSVAE